MAGSNLSFTWTSLVNSVFTAFLKGKDNNQKPEWEVYTKKKKETTLKLIYRPGRRYRQPRRNRSDNQAETTTMEQMQQPSRNNDQTEPKPDKDYL